MIPFTVYRPDGEILYVAMATDLETLALNVPDDLRVISGSFDGRAGYIDGGALVAFPPRPEGTQWRFDYAARAWTDPRTPADRAADLAARRARASLSRIDFLLAAVTAGIITQADAIAASRGEIPPGMADLIATMTPDAQFEAQVRWGAATDIARLDPFITGWAQTLGVTDEQLDQLFEVQT